MIDINLANINDAIRKLELLSRMFLNLDCFIDGPRDGYDERIRKEWEAMAEDCIKIKKFLNSYKNNITINN